MKEKTDGLGPAGAQLLAWSVLAVINQVVIALTVAPAPLGVLLLHHAYDAGQLLALGVASFLMVEGARRALARRAPTKRSPLVAVSGLGLAAFAVSLLTVEDDVTNAAGRYGVPVWTAMVFAAAGTATVLAPTALLHWVGRRFVRVGFGAVGPALAVANTFVLPGDYAAAHLVAACSPRCSSLRRREPCSRRSPFRRC